MSLRRTVSFLGFCFCSGRTHVGQETLRLGVRSVLHWRDLALYTSKHAIDNRMRKGNKKREIQKKIVSGFQGCPSVLLSTPRLRGVKSHSWAGLGATSLTGIVVTSRCMA